MSSITLALNQQIAQADGGSSNFADARFNRVLSLAIDTGASFTSAILPVASAVLPLGHIVRLDRTTYSKTSGARCRSCEP